MPCPVVLARGAWEVVTDTPAGLPGACYAQSLSHEQLQMSVCLVVVGVHFTHFPVGAVLDIVLPIGSPRTLFNIET